MLCAIKRAMKYIPAQVEIKKRKKRIPPFSNGVTILSNNCIGGCIYHDTGKQFLSPTINLFMSIDDFISFCLDLKYYIEQDLIEVNDGSKVFPIGKLGGKGKTITLNFQHYKTFSDAWQKWDDRKRRIIFSNIVVFLEAPNGLTPEQIAKIKKMPYKTIVFGPNAINEPFVYDLGIYDEKYYPGKSLDYISLCSGKRYIDRFDYISFIYNK